MFNKPVYKVINKETNMSLPDIFDTFMEAYKARMGWTKDAVIECYHGEEVEEVWNIEYEMMGV